MQPKGFRSICINHEISPWDGNIWKIVESKWFRKNKINLAKSLNGSPVDPGDIRISIRVDTYRVTRTCAFADFESRRTRWIRELWDIYRTLCTGNFATKPPRLCTTTCKYNTGTNPLLKRILARHDIRRYWPYDLPLRWDITFSECQRVHQLKRAIRSSVETRIFSLIPLYWPHV